MRLRCWGMKQSKCKWVRLGDYISRIDERNSDNSIKVVKSVSVFKELRDTGAKVNKADLHNYKIVYPGDISFVQTTGNEKCLAAAINNFDYPIVVTSVNEVIRTDKERLRPEYLMLFFLRRETDRYARFHSWGSARETFTLQDMCRVQIPLPPIEEQQKVVNAWKALREIKEQNEAIAAPLMQVCQSYIQELKYKYESVEIGPYINRIDKRNSDNAVMVVKSVSVLKVFNDTNAKVDKNNLTSYKVVEPNQISFVQTTGNEKCLCAAINHYDYPVVVTSVNEVFETDSLMLNPDFLHLWFRRTELDRYARFHSWGSARETFTFEDMKCVRIPLPPIDVQQSIVNLYNCANEAKKIAEEADKKSREICPALIQYVINRNYEENSNILFDDLAEPYNKRSTYEVYGDSY